MTPEHPFLNIHIPFSNKRISVYEDVLWNNYRLPLLSGVDIVALTLVKLKLPEYVIV